MEKIKQHYMLNIKRGEKHPIFNLAYLPENIASLVETPVIILEYFLVIFFTLNIIIIAFEKYTMQFVPALVLNGFSVDLFKMFHTDSDLLNNVVALTLTILIYVTSYRYFEFVKYNLHPEKLKITKNSSTKKSVDTE